MLIELGFVIIKLNMFKVMCDRKWYYGWYFFICLLLFKILCYLEKVLKDFLFLWGGIWFICYGVIFKGLIFFVYVKIIIDFGFGLIIIFGCYVFFYK